jgi:hypothetical protein
LYLGLALSTFVLWPLPLLHGRKPYLLIALALCLPLQLPQAIIVSSFRSPSTGTYRTGLLVSRFLTGFFLGFANINFFTVLLDLFGASLQSHTPHQEIVIPGDVRHDGGGMGIWLGIWSWCSLGSIAIGFTSGAGTINRYNPQWGFYITVIVLAISLFLNIITPETRRSAYRRNFKKYTVGEDEKLSKTVGRGEIKLHMSTTPPDYWVQEVWAGLWLSFLMLYQRGFFVLAFYLGWIYAQVVLIIIVSLEKPISKWILTSGHPSSSAPFYRANTDSRPSTSASVFLVLRLAPSWPSPSAKQACSVVRATDLPGQTA